MDSPVKKVGISTPGRTLEQTVDPQLQALREYAQRRGLEIVGEYGDVGISGSKDNRPELNRCLKAALAREFDALIAGV